MFFRVMFYSLLCGAALGPVSAATAPKKAPPKAAAPATAKPTPAPIPTQVRAGLDRMGAALRALSSFELKADVTTEDVLVSGQKLQSSAVMTFDVRRPNRLFVDILSPRKHRQLFYNGRQLTVFGPETGYYASVDAPPSIAAMLKLAADKYGIEMPMADLFEWGTSAFPVSRIESAIYAGKDDIAGRTCEHYAFRQPQVDWQLWLGQDDNLPCKLVITDRVDPVQPQTVAVYRWSTGSSFADSQFTFEPPSGQGKRIVLGQVGPATAEGGK